MLSVSTVAAEEPFIITAASNCAWETLVIITAASVPRRSIWMEAFIIINRGSIGGRLKSEDPLIITVPSGTMDMEWWFFVKIILDSIRPVCDHDHMKYEVAINGNYLYYGKSDERAKDLFQAAINIMRSVGGTGRIVFSNSDNRGEKDFINGVEKEWEQALPSKEECVRAGTHMNRCTGDGYCKVCFQQ
jgi:hypothetical protein